MNNLFRKIRQKLLAERRLGRYLLYAIGEIVLVVIGILIALEVNNRNEVQKLHEKELVLLKNIRNDLALDTIDLKSNIRIYTQVLEAEKSLFKFIQSDLIIPEQKIDYRFASVGFLIYEPHEASYNSFQFNDISVMSNQELKQKISRCRM